ncbi:MAG: murein L,D-transpeptidase [Rhizobiaceae bacterium]|nr:murein L,D-transpeptidase [Rhizobiaceae bacterium]
MISNVLRVGWVVAALAVAGCTSESTLGSASNAAATKQLSEKMIATMKAKGMTRESPVMARIFKEEGKLEVWKQKTNGRYDLLVTYDICKWSGQLGPKYMEGDRQAPEGFYTVRPAHMNPNSKYHLSFNIGYPNAYDRANGRTGSNLMVHGACSSSGCYSMTDDQMEQIYAFARDSFRGGQTDFQIQSFPFRMTAVNMARYRNDPNYPFWQMLKEGYDQFEITKVPPKVDVCGKRYVFNQVPEGDATFVADKPCPPTTQPQSLVSAYERYQKNYNVAFNQATRSSKQQPSQTIDGTKEALLVQDWTKRRGRGERVPIEPPSLEPDGTVKVTSRMGRIDSPEGRRMAALDAAAAEKAKAEADKKRAEEQQQIAAAQAAAQAEAAVAQTAAVQPAGESTEAPVSSIVAAPTEEPGMLSNVRKRLTGMFGS